MHVNRRKIIEYLFRAGTEACSDQIEVIEALQATGLRIIDPISRWLAPAAGPMSPQSPLANSNLTSALAAAGVSIPCYTELLSRVDDQLEIFGIEFIPHPLITPLGTSGVRRFCDFFSVHIKNSNTRRAYATATGNFLNWCEAHGIESLADVQTEHVAAYFEDQKSKSSILVAGQRLSAIRHMFNWMIADQNVSKNPVVTKRYLLKYLYN